MEIGKDYVGISIVYFCHDGNGNFVMNKRSNQCRDEKGKWDIGGGALVNESVESTLRREIKEEYCTDVVSFEFLGYRDVIREHEGSKTHWIALDFKVLVDPEKVANGEPHKFDAVEWFTLNKIPDSIHSQLPTFLKLYDEKLVN